MKKLSKAVTGGILAEELERVALRARALTTVLDKDVKDETQDGLVQLLDDVVTDLEELLPVAHALASPKLVVGLKTK